MKNLGVNKMDWFKESINKKFFDELKTSKKIKYIKIAEEVKKYIDDSLNENKKIAEIGCGPAHLMRFSLPIKYYDKYPVDKSIEYYDMNDQYMPLPVADLYIFMGVIEYVENIQNFFLKFESGAEIIAYFTCAKYPRSIIRLLFNEWKTKSEFNNFFTLNKFKKICEESKLTIKEIKRIGPNKLSIPHESYIFIIKKEGK
jgi:hypothetical protein